MNLTEKIKKICNTPAVNGRLKAELRFLTQSSFLRGGAFDELLQSACDWILKQVAVNGWIGAELTQKAEEKLASLVPIAKEYTFHCVSHAHIDMNWQWGAQETANLTLDTFRTMLQLMEEYPEFTFSQSQASTYAMCAEYDPELFEQIVRRVKEGRWEVTASTWTEADKNLPSGESLARHHLYTKAFMKEKFGLAEEQLCIDFEPDTFGHSAYVPEILKESGIKYYYHCRGGNLIPAYRYRAPSGAEILCYQDPCFYNSLIDENSFEFISFLEETSGIRVGLRVYGVGDHGGGPSRRDIERLREMQTWPLFPTILFSTYRAFFEALETRREQLPVVDKERNFIFTGCYSSQSRIKSGNRACEDRLFEAETLSALAGVLNHETPYTDNYRKAWRYVMFNQFHDILPGSCVRDSREHALGGYQEALSYAGAGLTKGMLSLAQAIDSSAIEAEEDLLSRSEGAGVGFASALHERALHTAAEYGRGKVRILHVFNPTNYERSETVTLTIWEWPGNEAAMVVTDVQGKPLAFHQHGRQHYWTHQYIPIDVCVTVAPFGVTTVVIKEEEQQRLPLIQPLNGGWDARIEEVRANVLENDKIKAEFDTDMCLISLIDKTTGQEMIREKAGYLEYYVESGRIHMPNAWTEGPAVFTCNMNEQGNVYIADRDGRTPVGQSIEYQLEFKESKMTVTVSLDKDSSVLRYRVTADWHQNGDQQAEIPTMRFKVPLAYDCSEFLYDVPMGMVTRPALMHDVPGRCFGFAGDSTTKRGLALLCDTQGAFRGWDNTLGITLLRATSVPDDYPEYGRHDYSVGIAVLPCDHMKIFQTAHCFIHPLSFASVRPHAGILPCHGQFMNVSGDVIVSAVKTPEKGNANEMIVRFYSISDAVQTVKLTFFKTPLTAQVVNTLEQPQGDLEIIDNTVTAEIAGRSSMSVYVRF